jgi:hypothetical protein
MKRLFLLTGGLAAAALAWPAPAQPVMPQSVADYPGAAAVKRAEARAKAGAAECLSELKGGRSGAACGRYHAAVLDALDKEHRRFNWCMPRMSEASNIPIPAACFATPEEMKIDAVEGLERKVAPKAWVAFDNQMAKYSN